MLMQNKHSKGLSANQIRGVELYISVLIKNISLPKRNFGSNYTLIAKCLAMRD